MANNLLTAQRMELARLITHQQRFIGPTLAVIQHDWERVETRQYQTADELAILIGNLRINLGTTLAALNAIDAVDRPVIPTGGNGSPLKNVGEAGDDGKR